MGKSLTFTVNKLTLLLARYYQNITLLKLPAFRRQKKIPKDRREAIKTWLDTMESFLLTSDWFAGDDLTIADFFFLANIETIKVRICCCKEFNYNLIFF